MEAILRLAALCLLAVEAVDAWNWRLDAWNWDCDVDVQPPRNRLGVRPEHRPFIDANGAPPDVLNPDGLHQPILRQEQNEDMKELRDRICADMRARNMRRPT